MNPAILRSIVRPALLKESQWDAHIVLQSLDDFYAIVAKVQLTQIHQVLQTLDLGQPVALKLYRREWKSSPKEWTQSELLHKKEFQEHFYRAQII